MDTRTGKIYDTEAEALEDGVPRDRLVTGTREALEELRPRIRFSKGSFKPAKADVPRDR
jgi:hypothetical protein